MSPFASCIGQFRRTAATLRGLVIASFLAVSGATLASCDSSSNAGGSGSEIPAIAIVVIDPSPSSQTVGAKEWRIWRVSNESGEPRLVLVAVLRDSTELLRLPSMAGYYLAEGWTETSGTDTVPSVVSVKSSTQTSALASCVQQIDRIPQGDTARISLCSDSSIAPSADIAAARVPNYLVVFKMNVQAVETQRVTIDRDSATRLRPTHWRLWSIDSTTDDSLQVSFAGNYYSDSPWEGEAALPLDQGGKKWLIEAWTVDPSKAMLPPSATVTLVARIDRKAYAACASQTTSRNSPDLNSIELTACPDASNLSPSSRVPGSRTPDAIAVYPSHRMAITMATKTF